MSSPRLANSEIQLILATCARFLPDQEINIYIYGSRAIEHKKGGDLDLLWIVPEASLINLQSNKYKVLAALKSELGEQKIDLSIACQNDIETDPFYKHILKSALSL